MHRKFDAGRAGPGELGPLVRAVAEKREVEFDYFTQGRGEVQRRCVRPNEVFSHRGQWYLAGFDVQREEARLFRVDRVQALTVTERTFEADPSARAHVPDPAGQGEVRVRFSALAAPYIRERFGDDARPAPEGAVDVLVPGDSERWLTQWVLSFGGEAWVVAPEWARQAVARGARGSLES